MVQLLFFCLLKSVSSLYNFHNYIFLLIVVFPLIALKVAEDCIMDYAFIVDVGVCCRMDGLSALRDA